MYELFAMSSKEPATVSISLEEFAKHGGLTGPHKDGWGVVYYVGNDIHVMREPSPASSSPSIDFIRSQSYRSTIVISHIRQASTGAVKMANTQPFCRELGGRMHVFAHNGDLDNIDTLHGNRSGRFRPLGDSDSEKAFCLLMSAMEEIWLSDELPSLGQRMEVVYWFAEKIRNLGTANFIYSDSEVLFVHGHKRTHPDDKIIRPPGLHILCRTCHARRPAHSNIGGLEISFPPAKQEVLLVASVPLTQEKWTPLAEGEILVAMKGKTLLETELS
jgi:predicted glutamine amidotransferase